MMKNKNGLLFFYNLRFVVPNYLLTYWLSNRPLHDLDNLRTEASKSVYDWPRSETPACSGSIVKNFIIF